MRREPTPAVVEAAEQEEILDAGYFAEDAEDGEDEGIEVEPEMLEEVAISPVQEPTFLPQEDEELPLPDEPEREYNDGMALFDESEPPAGALTGGAEPEPPAPEPETEPQPPAAPPTPQPKVVAEEESAPYTLDEVQRAWPRFLRQAEEVSKRASVQLASAHPTAVVGRTVLLTFSSPSSFEMMNQPKQLEFIRKLLAMVLECGESVPVRLELSEEETTLAMKFERPAEKPKLRHDPLEKLKALRSGEAISTPSAPDYAPASERPPTPRVAERRESLAPSPPPASSRGEAVNPWAVRHDEPQRGPKEDPEAIAKRETALAEALVQDALEVFGGEIVVD